MTDRESLKQMIDAMQYHAKDVDAKIDNALRIVGSIRTDCIDLLRQAKEILEEAGIKAAEKE